MSLPVLRKRVQAIRNRPGKPVQPRLELFLEHPEVKRFIRTSVPTIEMLNIAFQKTNRDPSFSRALEFLQHTSPQKRVAGLRLLVEGFPNSHENFFLVRNFLRDPAESVQLQALHWFEKNPRLLMDLVPVKGMTTPLTPRQLAFRDLLSRTKDRSPRVQLHSQRAMLNLYWELRKITESSMGKERWKSKGPLPPAAVHEKVEIRRDLHALQVDEKEFRAVLVRYLKKAMQGSGPLIQKEAKLALRKLGE